MRLKVRKVHLIYGLKTKHIWNYSNDKQISAEFTDGFFWCTETNKETRIHLHNKEFETRYGRKVEQFLKLFGQMTVCLECNGFNLTTGGEEKKHGLRGRTDLILR